LSRSVASSATSCRAALRRSRYNRARTAVPHSSWERGVALESLPKRKPDGAHAKQTADPKAGSHPSGSDPHQAGGADVRVAAYTASGLSAPGQQVDGYRPANGMRPALRIIGSRRTPTPSRASRPLHPRTYTAHLEDGERSADGRVRRADVFGGRTESQTEASLRFVNHY
jgi:hypothetical protein